MQDLDWNDLRYVLAAGRGGTLADAARRLRVNETTVARRIARIERHLGARLFGRAGGRLSPTEAGETVLAHAERIETETGALEAAVRGADRIVAGSVRLTAVPILINRLFVPASETLRAAHPDLHLELIADARNLSLSRRETDIALRLGRPSHEQAAIARRIGRLDYGVYAASADTAKGGFGMLPWIGYDEAMADLPQARWIAGAAAADAAPIALRVNDAEAILQAARAGLGRSLLPAAIAERASGLRRLDGPSPALSRELWLMLHPELRPLARIRAVSDWIVETVAALSARIETPRR
jgi:DNA-binding transcriptional LysR family regulator